MKHILKIGNITVACLLFSFVFAFLFSSNAFATAAPQPNQIVKTATGEAKGYDLAKLLRSPGVKLVKTEVKAHSFRTVTKTPNAVSPNITTRSGSYSLTVTAVLTWVFWYGNFLCGYGTGGAESNPWTADVNELGDLYVNGNWKGDTDTSNWTSTWGETGCWSYGAGTLWEMSVSGAAAFWWGGPQLWTQTSVWAVQP